jgi:cell division protein FtsB
MNNSAQKKRKTISSFPRQRGREYNVYRLVSSIGIFVILGLLIMIGAQYLQQYKVKLELAEYESRMEQEKARQAYIEAEIERLQNLDYLELLARERLGLVKPGEIIFQLED